MFELFKPKIKSNTWAIVVLLLMITAAMLCGCDIVEDQGSDTDGSEFGELIGNVRLTVVDAEGLTVLSQNPVDINIGGNVTVEFELEDGVIIESVSHGTVEGNTIVLQDVYAPTTLRIKTRRLSLFEMSVSSADESQGSVTASLDLSEKIYEGEQITLSAKPVNKKYAFAGYSVNAPIDQGGTLLSGDPEYTFTVSESLKIYANFFLLKNDPADSVIIPDGKWVLIYHPNGGVISQDNSLEMLTSYFDNTHYLCPNTIPNDGSFIREGYVLMGYNTEEDGSGTFYAPGWNVIMPERGAISLYCVWVKETPKTEFKYSSNGSYITIEQYIGEDESFVVIPEKIDGLPVEVIKSEAFNRKKSVEEIFISRNIKTIESKAFSSCAYLTTLHFSDSVLNIDNSCVYSCPKFSTLSMMATRYPIYANTTRNGNFCIKYERLITVQGPKLILASGSNSAFGIDSALFEQLLAENGYNYSLVNYGTNASANITFFLEVISHFINEGDIVIQAPEPAHKSQWGTTVFTSHIWQMFEGAYEAISLVNISSYSDVFKTYSAYAKARNNKAGVSYEKFYENKSDMINYYGDIISPRIGHSSSYKKNNIDVYLAQGGCGSVSYKNTIEYIKANYRNLNYFIGLIKEKGGICLLTFGTANYICLDKASQIAGGQLQTQLESTVDQLIDSIRISSVATYSMDYQWFYETDFHLNTAGAELRTKLLVEDLLNYLKTAR